MSNELVYTGDFTAVKDWLKSKCAPNAKYLLKLSPYRKKRTLSQSAQSFVWYSQLADELKEENKQGWRRFCKLHFGIGILRHDDLEFKSFYDKALLNLDYESKVQAMDFVPVTSLMNTEQFGRYFEAMQAHFLKRGVMLEFLNQPPITE